MQGAPDTIKKRRVVMAMSGGVDSSVAAALLLEEGYEVIGLTMDIGTGPAAVEAAKAAAKLGIHHEVLDLRACFQDTVVAYFTSEYLSGRTPNPCAVCNRHIKFGELRKRAAQLGAKLLATGHYARIRVDEKSGRHLLYKAKDKGKDQSYFLSRLTQEQLAGSIFPLGELHKTEIREKARELGLPAADRPESQEICFIPDNDYKRFIALRVPAAKIKPGRFRDLSGKELGKHAGLPYYTVGQRKGLGVALGYPAYVVALDCTNNEVILGRDEDLYQSGLLAADNNLIALAELTEPLEVEAKIRSAAKPAAARLSHGPEGLLAVEFFEPQRAITPGQVVAYYQGDLVIGGGIVKAGL